MISHEKKQDKLILKAFIANKIPSYIKDQSIGNWDLMVCYEELFNYTHGLLDGQRIDTSINSFGTDRGFVFDQEYKNILLDLSNNSDDVNIKIHCYLSLTVLCILRKYADLQDL